MNKLLLASTALVASTTFAMANVDVSGSAEMGVFGVSESDEDVLDRDLQFHTDVDVTFTMSGETDGGITFGASIDLDESDGAGARGNSIAFDGNTQGGETIFVDGAYGRLTMGDTDGGFDWALEEAIIGGSITDNNETVGYNGNSGIDGMYDGQVARYEYAFSDFAVAVSGEIDDAGDSDPILGLGVRYSGDLAGVTFGAGLGFQSIDTPTMDAEVIGLSLSGKMANGVQAILNYSDLDGVGGNDDHYGIAVGYEFGEFLVAANYGQFDRVGGGDNNGYGLVANYDLGGGAALQAGYGYNDPVAGDTFDTYSFGISMSF